MQNENQKRCVVHGTGSSEGGTKGTLSILSEMFLLCIYCCNYHRDPSHHLLIVRLNMKILDYHPDRRQVDTGGLGQGPVMPSVAC